MHLLLIPPPLAQSPFQVEAEYESEYEERVAGDRDAMDPYVYDLYHAVRYVEEFGGEKWDCNRGLEKLRTGKYVCSVVSL